MMYIKLDYIENMKMVAIYFLVDRKLVALESSRRDREMGVVFTGSLTGDFNAAHSSDADGIVGDASIGSAFVVVYR